MAVLSRPSLRSSQPRGQGQALPAIEKPSQPNESRKGKRGRPSSSGHDSDTSGKKLKTHANPKHNKTSRQIRDALKTLPFRARQPADTDTVAQDARSKKLDPVLIQPKNGFLISSSDTEDSPHYGINQNLPPTSADQVDKRTLRSHGGGSRAKSELALYFSNYEDLISIEPRPSDILTPETLLHITDDSTSSVLSTKAPLQGKGGRKSQPPIQSRATAGDVPRPCMDWPEELFATLHESTRLDLAVLESRIKKPANDPLDDTIYLRAHSREERKEKQLRNIEKERAMHEKSQLERLLDGLKGHDWLRVMGISGITDGEKKAYEPKRDNLIVLVKALLEKFRLWKEEEKRRKAEKDEELEEDSEDEKAEDEDEDEDEDEADDDAIEQRIYDLEQSSDPGGESDGDPPDYNEADISAARQLQAEALNVKRQKMSDLNVESATGTPKIASKDPFKSFYSKPYLRTAAVGNHRRSGRTRMAFGEPLPDLAEYEFDLPTDIKTTEALLESGRRMRHSKRDVKDTT